MKKTSQYALGMAIAACLGMVFLPLHLPQKGLRSAAIAQKHIKMALPNTITVTGAGTASANGTYTPYSGGGDAKWANGTDFIVSGNGYWAICGQNVYNGARYYSFGADPNSSTTFPPDGTTNQSGIGSNGAAPNPTFTSQGTYTVPPKAVANVTEPPLFTEAAQRGPQTRSRAAAAALLTTAAFGMVTSAPRTLAPVNVVVKLFAPSAQRGPVSLGSRSVNVSLLSETSPQRGQALPPVEAVETLLTAAAQRGPASYALRSGEAGQTLLLTSGGRGGRVSPAGTTAVPIVINEPPLLTALAARSAVSLAARNVNIVLLTQGVKSGARGITRAVVIPLLSAKAQAGRITPAPKPENVDPRDPFQVFRAELLYLASLKGGSPVAFADTLLAILDNLAASYRTNELNLAANTVAGLPVLIRGGDGSPGNTGYGFGQDTPILELLPAADQLIASFVPAKILDALYRPIFTKIDGVLIGQGYASLNVYLTSLNAAAPASRLVHPNAALLYYLYKNQQGNLLLSPGNVFAPQTAFGQAVVGSGGSVAYTDLSAIPAANSTSPTPGLSTQGYTGSKGIALLVTAAINGTLVITATTASGVTWTGDIGNKATGQTTLMTPGTAGARVYDVTGVSGAGAATAGAFQVNSVFERAVG